MSSNKREVVSVTNTTGLPIPLAEQQIGSGETAEVKLDTTTQNYIDIGELVVVEQQSKKGHD